MYPLWAVAYHARTEGRKSPENCEQSSFLRKILDSILIPPQLHAPPALCTLWERTRAHPSEKEATQ